MERDHSGDNLPLAAKCDAAGRRIISPSKEEKRMWNFFV
jgi:hypothetical protein